MPFTCLEVVKAALGQPKEQSGDELYFLCPIHDDHHPSLAVNEKKNLWMCGPCGAKGNAWQLAAFLNCFDRSDEDSVNAWLREHHLLAGSNNNGRPVIVKEYVYQNSDGHPALKILRYEPKDFRQQVWDGTSWYWKGQKPKLLYHLPELLAEPHRMVLLPEGEKDVDQLISLGFLATCNPGGSGKWEDPYTKTLKGHPVAILPDNDPPGHAHAVKVALVLLKASSEVRIVELPGLNEKEDVSDWLDAGHTREELKECIRNTQPLTKAALAELEAGFSNTPAETSQPILRRASEIEPQEVEWLWKPYIPLGKLTVIVGNPGVGKSFFAMTLAAIVSSGRPFPNLETGFPDKNERNEPAPVLFASVEDAPEDTLVPRLISMKADRSNIHFFEGVRRWDSDAEKWVNDFVSFENLSEIESALKTTKCKLAVFDPIQGFGGGKNMNQSHEVRGLLAPLAALAEKHHVAIFLIAHPRKSTTDRALQRLSGSVDIGAAARSVLMAGDAPQKDGERAIVHIKSNLAMHGPSLGYAIEDDGKSGEFRWTGISDLTAGDLLAPEQGPEKQTALDGATDFLNTTLEGGAVLVTDLKREAITAGLSWRTVERAKEQMPEVKAIHPGGRGTPWFWEKKVKGRQGSQRAYPLSTAGGLKDDDDIEFIEP